MAKRDQTPYLSYNCSGEGCVSKNPWPVHHVRYRSNLCRLCTSCVLRNHPGAFCPKCFDIIDSSCGRSSLVHCVSCPSVCHIACLSDDEDTSSFVCPICANANGHSYFPLDLISEVDELSELDASSVSDLPRKKIRGSDEDELEGIVREDGEQQGRKVFDVESAKILLTAATLASSSMQKAIAVARIEAERKAKDAVLAKRKAKEMLEKSLMAAKMERNKKNHQTLNSAKIEGKLVPKIGSENHWLDIQEAVPISQICPVRAITMSEPGKITFPSNLESKDIAPRPPMRKPGHLTIVNSE